MSTPNINCILQAVLAAQNNVVTPPAQIATYDFGNPTFPATQMFFDPFFQVGLTLVNPPLPVANTFGVMVQNLSASQVVNVIFTPNGGGGQTIKLGPALVGASGGDLFIYWCPSQNAALGIINFGLQASAANTPVMLLMVG